MIKQNLYIIVAIDKNRGIGKNGVLPWELKNDLQYFQEITTKTKDPEKQHAIIMGRKTWESIPEQHRPLKNRKNLILTSNKEYQAPGGEIHSSFESALKSIDKNIEDVFVIGGGKLFNETIHRDNLSGLYITQIHHSFECDTFFPEIPPHFNKISKLGEVDETGILYDYMLYER